MLKTKTIVFSIFMIVSLSSFAEDTPKRDIKSLLKFAKKFQGVPYKYGGTSPSAFDCSGFVRYVFNHFGHALYQPSYDLVGVGYQLPVSDLKAGDLIFFRKSPSYKSRINHVGIVVKSKGGDVIFIHASTSRGITISSLNEETYFKSRVEGGVRL